MSEPPRDRRPNDRSQLGDVGRDQHDTIAGPLQRTNICFGVREGLLCNAVVTFSGTARDMLGEKISKGSDCRVIKEGAQREGDAENTFHLGDHAGGG